MALNRWWAREPRERFWLESTDRQDIGSDLRAPLMDNLGRDNWRYTIVREARIGDLVFHYDKRAQAITAISRIAGKPIEATITWAARGSYARNRNAQPQPQPGYQLPLDRHLRLSVPLTLQQLRDAKGDIAAIQSGISAANSGPLYLPFETADRALRPLQGYAFKLPADFVEAFPVLREAVAKVGNADESGLSEGEVFRRAIDGMEAAAHNHLIGKLQSERAQRLGLARVSRRLFSTKVKAVDWVFHHGGRQELQFNTGLDFMPDGSRAFRAGLAFSFELSRSLPSIDNFLPKVERFNSWMRERAGEYSDLTMWHWQAGRRSSDYSCGPLSEALVRTDTFVFLGDRQPVSAIDPERALKTFDHLLPLYRWVEAGEPDASASLLSSRGIKEVLCLDGGRDIDGGRWISASRPARVLDIFLRHAEVQRRLKEMLLAEGCSRVLTEVPLGQRSIDVVAQEGGELWFYEVKIATTMRACLREAIGQLLEYALWPGSTRPARLVVVGEHPIDAAGAEYLALLNERFPIPLGYRQLSLGL